MRLRLRTVVIFAAALSMVLPACETVDPSGDGGVADASSDAETLPPIDASPDEDGATELDASPDADAGDPDAGDPDAGCTSSAACEDGDECTVDSCELGACSSAPIDPDDADACTVDSCDPATGVAHDPVSADDGDACTVDSCDPATGVAHVAVTTDDGDACTVDSCDPTTGIAHVAVSTDDGDVCTADACDAALGVTHTPVPNCCATAADCASGICTANTCLPASCGDGVQNGSETAIDCGGGTCAPCANSLACLGPSDCASGACVDNRCVECATAVTCPGSDTECQVRTCSANVCGFSFTASGTVVGAQTAGDCQRRQCDGAGAITPVPDDTDLPADDGNQCTDEACTAGVPGHPAIPTGAACAQNGGALCDGAGACVECVTASSCLGSDTECQIRTCTANVCGVSFTTAGTAVASQIAGDCRQRQCNGAGAIVSVSSDIDVPADDGNQCTDDVCIAGAPSHPASAGGTSCNQSGGVQCDGGGACVECVAASECPGVDSECQVRTCGAGACGVAFTAAGTPVTSQTAGDCQQNECNGTGAIASAADDSDVPDDGNQCTSDLCAAGVPSNDALAAGTACNQGSGTECDGTGTCIAPAAPVVTSTTPADSTSAVATTDLAVTFSTAMDPATLTGQTTAGACSGAIQISLDAFASCIALSSATAAMSAGDTTATFTASPGLLANRTYRIRVTTAASSASGTAMAAPFTMPNGFITGSPDLCAGSVVIEQLYGAGGNVGALVTHDYVVLHNRGTTPVTMAGWSLQYAGATGTSWGAASLSGTIQPSAHFLIQLATGGAVGAALPPPDATGTINLSGTAGKLALVSNSTPLTGSCPTGAHIVDFVGFGTADCFEGSAPTPAPSSTTAIFRVEGGCGDVNHNAADFTIAAPSPKNSATPASPCACTVLDESGAAGEADYCNVQFPTSLAIAAGAPSTTVYGHLYETGTTEAAGAASTVRAQLGYGPASANPEYEPGWSWTNATFNVQSGDNDEYQASFTAPAAGAYRYAYRFSLDRGVSWTTCDLNGTGSNAGLALDFAQLPVMTVSP